MREIVVDGSALTVEDVVAVAYGQARASLGPDVPRRMETSRSVVVRALSGDAPVYGVNTGFGALADTPVGEADLATLQGAIVRSHAAMRWSARCSCYGPGRLPRGTPGCARRYPPGCSSCFP
jgi:histidine ammonia-lyase